MQLVEIARALSRGARLVIMDEPTSALDEPLVKQDLLALPLREAREQAPLAVAVEKTGIVRLVELTAISDSTSLRAFLSLSLLSAKRGFCVPPL